MADVMLERVVLLAQLIVVAMKMNIAIPVHVFLNLIVVMENVTLTKTAHHALQIVDVKTTNIVIVALV